MAAASDESRSKEGMQPIVVVGSMSRDLTAVSPRLPGPGETLMGSKFVQSFGGKGAN